ncbi:MAG TPA: hypothetical protein VL326_17075 [Kofleriaceae bacterium]|jgi:hypothetical protein|nr:hypothetical protein [Kofleriaceae bacterium]
MTRASLMLALVVLVVGVRVASAEAPGALPSDPVQAVPDLEPGDPGYRSPGVALGLSLGFTAAGAGLITWGYAEGNGGRSGGPTKSTIGTIKTTGVLVAFVGPTTGHIYAGKTWNRGLKWRLISLGAFAVTGTITLVGSAGSKEVEPVTLAFAIAAGASATAYLGATVYEVATAPRAARRHNRRGPETTITIAPTLGRDPGLAVLGTF